MAGDYNALI
jgi:hypothetical protein